MELTEYKSRWQSLMKAVGESHDDWWAIWQDTFSEQKHKWLVGFLETVLASLDSDPVYVETETEIARSLGSRASMKAIVFGQRVIVEAAGEFGSNNPDAKPLEVRIFPRSAIRSVVPTSIGAGSLDDDVFPSTAEATVDYGDFGEFDLGNAYGQTASRNASERFARFLPDLISDLAATR